MPLRGCVVVVGDVGPLVVAAVAAAGAAAGGATAGALATSTGGGVVAAADTVAVIAPGENGAEAGWPLTRSTIEPSSSRSSSSERGSVGGFSRSIS